MFWTVILWIFGIYFSGVFTMYIFEALIGFDRIGAPLYDGLDRGPSITVVAWVWFLALPVILFVVVDNLFRWIRDQRRKRAKLRKEIAEEKKMLKQRMEDRKTRNEQAEEV